MKNKSIQKVLNNSNFKSYSGLILVIIVVSVFMSIRSENFMTPTNILNVLRQISVYGILACGMAFAMMTGGIDLTVGSTAGVCGALVTKFVVEGNMPLVPAILIGLLVGALFRTALRHLYRQDRNPSIYHDPGHADYPERGMLPDL